MPGIHASSIEQLMHERRGTDMHRRTRLGVCLPAALFLALCFTSLLGVVIDLSWMAIGHRGLESFPRAAPSVEWRSGYRSGCV